MVTLCVLDFFEIFDFEFIQHLDDFEGVTDEDEVVTTLRMRGTGIFQDPNDMAAVIVVAGISVYLFLDGQVIREPAIRLVDPFGGVICRFALHQIARWFAGVWRDRADVHHPGSLRQEK